jgi:hypothetical protein
MIGRETLVIALAAVLFGGSVSAAPRSLAVVGRVSVEGGVINDAFALDDAGRTLAWVETTGAGQVRMHIAPVTSGWSGSTVNLTDFTVTPERIHFVGGQWIVVASEGERRVAAVVSGSKLGAPIGPFGEGLVSAVGGKKFVTVTERTQAEERRFTIAAYRPGGGLLAQKQIAIGPEGDIAGKGLGFIGFTSGYLQALVKKPGVYNPRTDARGPAQIAVYDVLAERAGAAKALPNIPRFLDFAVKRNERPGQELFVRRDDAGLELVGPADKLRPLALPAKLEHFEPTDIVQQATGGRLIFSLVRDGITDDVAATGKKGPRTLAFFAADAGSGKVTVLGEVPLGEGTEFVWSAGGNRIAVLHKTHDNAGTTLVVYER